MKFKLVGSIEMCYGFFLGKIDCGVNSLNAILLAGPLPVIKAIIGD